MPKERKPTWVNPGKGRPGYFRTIIDGKIHRCPLAIDRHEKPAWKGIPDRAWEWLHALEAEHAANHAAMDHPTAGMLCRLYLQWAKVEVAAGRLSQGQYDGMKSRLRVVLAHTDATRIDARKFTVNHVADFFDRIKPRFSEHYRAGIGRTLRACFRWGAKAIPGREPIRILAENPLAGYDFPRPPRATRGYVEGDVVRRFLRWAWARGRASQGLARRFERMFVLLLRFQRLTGCRPGEACDLRWLDIIWEPEEHARAVIPKERHKAGAKTGKERVIYLTRGALRLLRTIQRIEGRHETHVFTHMRGTGATARGQLSPLAGEPWPSGSAASKKLAKLRAAALAVGLGGLEGVGPKKLVAYANRHGYASEAIFGGASHEETAALLGNTAAVVAQTYTHAITAREAELARKLAARGKGSGDRS